MSKLTMVSINPMQAARWAFEIVVRARALYAASWYDTVCRPELAALPGPPLEQPETLTLTSLLAGVLVYALDDVAAVVRRADPGLRDLRRQTAPNDLVIAPAFAASDFVGGAGAPIREEVTTGPGCRSYRTR